MKKLLSITTTIVINLLLTLIAIRMFNPLRLTLSGINYINIGNYFSPEPLVNIFLFGCLIGLIIFNIKKNKVLSILNIILINGLLLSLFCILFNPFNRTVGFMITRPEWFFSPNPIYNIILTGCLLGLILYNTNLIVNRKK